MDYILSFHQSPALRKGVKYEIGSGLGHSLSFSFITSKEKVRYDDYYIFADISKTSFSSDALELGNYRDGHREIESIVFGEQIEHDLEYNSFPGIHAKVNNAHNLNIKKNLICFDSDFKNRKILTIGSLQVKKNHSRDIIRNKALSVLNCRNKAKAEIFNKFVSTRRGRVGIFLSGILNAFLDSKNLNKSDKSNQISKDLSNNSIVYYNLVNLILNEKSISEVSDIEFINILTNSLEYIENIKVEESDPKGILRNEIMSLGFGIKEIMNAVDPLLVEIRQKGLEDITDGLSVPGDRPDVYIGTHWSHIDRQNGGTDRERGLTSLSSHTAEIVASDTGETLGRGELGIDIGHYMGGLFKRINEITESNEHFSLYSELNSIQVNNSPALLRRGASSVLSNANILLKKDTKGSGIYNKVIAINRVVENPVIHVLRDDLFLSRNLHETYTNIVEVTSKSYAEVVACDGIIHLGEEDNFGDLRILSTESAGSNDKSAFVNDSHLSVEWYNTSANVQETIFAIGGYEDASCRYSGVDVEKNPHGSDMKRTFIFSKVKSRDVFKSNKLVNLGFENQKLKIIDGYIFTDRTIRNIKSQEKLISVIKDIRNIYYEKECVSIRESSRYLFEDKVRVGVSISTRELSEKSDDTTISKSSRSADYSTENVGVSSSDNPVAMGESSIKIDKLYRDASSYSDDDFVNKENRDLGSMDISIISLEDLSRESNIDDELCGVSESQRSAQDGADLVFASKGNRNVKESYETDIGLSKNARDTSTDMKIVSFSRGMVDTGIIYSHIAACVSSRQVDFSDKTLSFTRIGKEITDDDKLIMGHNKDRDLVINSFSHEISKSEHDIGINEEYKSLYRILNELRVEDSLFSISKQGYGTFSAEYIYNATKNLKSTLENDEWVFLNRDFDWDGHIRIGLTTDNEFWIIDKPMDASLPFVDITADKFMKNGMFDYKDIAATKAEKVGNLDCGNLLLGSDLRNAKIATVDVNCLKNIVDGAIYQDYSKWYEKDSQSIIVNPDYNLEFSKVSEDISVGYQSLWYKKASKAITYKNTFIEYSTQPSSIYFKSSIWLIGDSTPIEELDSSLYLSKVDKHSSFDDLNFVNKDILHGDFKSMIELSYADKHSNFAKDIFVNSTLVNTLVNGSMFINEDSSGIYEIDSLFAKHFPSGIAMNSSVFAERYDSGVEIDDSMFAEDYSRMVNLNMEVFAESPHEDITIDSNLFMEDYLNDTNAFPTFFANRVDSKSFIVEDTVNVDYKTKNSTFDYEEMFVTRIPYTGTDKPDVNRTGMIDELILPHKDYKYSDSLSKLMNSDGTINMEYVKSFDSETGEYTITLPVEHPLKMYADVGRDYLDVDTGVLEMTIHMIKEIWQENMFRYSGASAQDSLKDIMKKLDYKIKDVYEIDEEGKKQANRCLQLFRWYSEMSILNNCDYILKFYGTKVEVDYYESNLKELETVISLENMEFINYSLKVVDTAKKASITFQNKQKNLSPPLNIFLKLYNINISTSILREDGSECLKPGIHELELEVKANSTQVIEFNPNKEYQDMIVANLSTSNYSTNNFELTYKGRFGETNVVMQELLDKMLVVGDITDEVKEKFGDVAPVTIALNRLLEYYELHHKGKEKGKRLITKK